MLGAGAHGHQPKGSAGAERSDPPSIHSLVRRHPSDRIQGRRRLSCDHPFPLACEGDAEEEPIGASLSRIDEFVESVGRIAVEGAVELAPPGGELDGVWVGTTGTLSVVALENEEVPGLPGVSWSSFGTLRLNRLGMVCFAAVLKGAGIDSSNRDSSWCAANGGEPQLLARVGDPVASRPGENVVDFAVFSGTNLQDVELDDVGMNIFRIETTGGFGLFRMSSSGATTLAFGGESEPQAGLVYSGFDGDLIGSQPVSANQNGAGHAYTARLGVDPDDTRLRRRIRVRRHRQLVVLGIQTARTRAAYDTRSRTKLQLVAIWALRTFNANRDTVSDLMRGNLHHLWFRSRVVRGSPHSSIRIPDLDWA